MDNIATKFLGCSLDKEGWSIPSKRRVLILLLVTQIMVNARLIISIIWAIYHNPIKPELNY